MIGVKILPHQRITYMKKILLLLILIYTSCNGPSSSSPDLEKDIIGNWWLCRLFMVQDVGGNLDTTIRDYTLDSTNLIYSIKRDSIIIYTRSQPDWIPYSRYYYIEGNTLFIEDDDGDFIVYITSIKNGILSMQHYDVLPSILIHDYKKYTGPIPPEL